MSCSNKPFDEDALLEAFELIEKQDLVPTKIFMNEHDYKEIAGKPCERCGGRYYDPQNELACHPSDDCDLEIARRIMES